jgi:hypothetical protein
MVCLRMPTRTPGIERRHREERSDAAIGLDREDGTAVPRGLAMTSHIRGETHV